ncbi:uncharacterized protein YraI [Rhodobium orientis]|uniref:SH3b domain-containing protein n=1 Tax=Rhodobium orientis TaxID=34017 RepID=A0A327JTX1_9HYPH|nr:SH3 domain-containing protein [Rhodobium orientis]MBB4303977.1 uncharacterized protein YraI [Rhodobium orientis]MBK5950813.1 hypothetical protein [Rhodobium orientis]RAI29521.1 hypothetical protein CH339_02405 [Rhodobium orientis]
MKRTALAALGLGLVAALAASSGMATAATRSVATGDVNLRAGPGTSYPVVRVVPRGASVATHGCLKDYSWCDVSYARARGWVSARYLTTVVAGARVVVSPRVAVPVVTFGPAYWNRYYAAYPWYRRGPAYYGPANRGPAPRYYRGPRPCAGGCSGARVVTGPAGRTRVRRWHVNP